ncbi:DUF2487 family protein [Bacillus massiliigorillae]|uniref:DUF2487 family protein n=1 Tax=Bacillus massiliigorillae TaxID=1243664 RepID=UPI00039C0243|nr:DUF2487 family protein [Bacillus massiliigorillae]
MKWISKDVEMYIGAKEYVDTAIVPLLGITFQNGIKQSASINEFISIISQEIEKQFKGRVLLLPPVTYLNDGEMDMKKQQIYQWKQALEQEGFPFIFFLTSDADWKTIESEIGNSLLYLPSLPLESLDEKYKIPMMEEQVSDVLGIISRKWRT